LKAVKHPNIIAYHEAFKSKTQLCIIMDFAAGGDLAHRITKQSKSRIKFPETEVAAWTVQLLLALKYLHERKVLHRDIKPQNVFLTGKNMVKLGDFGIARVLESTAANARTQIGTPFYISPEIADGKPYNAPSDMWAMGCILYELMTFKPPFLGENIPQILKNIVMKPPPTLPSNYSPELRGVCLKLLSKKPEERPTADQAIKQKYIMKEMQAFLKRAQEEDLMEAGPQKGATAGDPKEQAENEQKKRELQRLRELEAKDAANAEVQWRAMEAQKQRQAMLARGRAPAGPPLVQPPWKGPQDEGDEGDEGGDLEKTQELEGTEVVPPEAFKEERSRQPAPPVPNHSALEQARALPMPPGHGGRPEGARRMGEPRGKQAPPTSVQSEFYRRQEEARKNRERCKDEHVVGFPDRAPLGEEEEAGNRAEMVRARARAEKEAMERERENLLAQARNEAMRNRERCQEERGDPYKDAPPSVAQPVGGDGSPGSRAEQVRARAKAEREASDRAHEKMLAHARVEAHRERVEAAQRNQKELFNGPEGGEGGLKRTPPREAGEAIRREAEGGSIKEAFMEAEDYPQAREGPVEDRKARKAREQEEREEELREAAAAAYAERKALEAKYRRRETTTPVANEMMSEEATEVMLEEALEEETESKAGDPPVKMHRALSAASEVCEPGS